MRYTLCALRYALCEVYCSLLTAHRLLLDYTAVQRDLLVINQNFK